MPNPISALDHTPYDFIREVSPDAISFYVDGLSGIYLPEVFKAENPDNVDVKYWRPSDRLSGKFGRFTIRAIEGDDEEENEVHHDGILVMGTTINLSDLDRGRMQDLKHYAFYESIDGILDQRGLDDENITVDQADYGFTHIELDNEGAATEVIVTGSSFDFGRANAKGRLETCEMFAKLLGNDIQIVNLDPEPREREQIIS